MLQNAPLQDETAEEVAEANEMDQMAWFEQLELEDSALMDDYDDDEEEQTQALDPSALPATVSARESTPNSVHIVVDDNETEVTIGTRQQKVKVQKAVLNAMSVRYVVALGRSKMVQLKIPTIRLRKRCRLTREIECLQKELSDYLSNKDGVSKVAKVMKILKEKVLVPECPIRVEFRMMQKGQWIVPSSYY